MKESNKQQVREVTNWLYTLQNMLMSIFGVATGTMINLIGFFPSTTTTTTTHFYFEGV